MRLSLNHAILVLGLAVSVATPELALASEPGEGVLQHAPDGSWGYSLYEDASVALVVTSLPQAVRLSLPPAMQ